MADQILTPEKRAQFLAKLSESANVTVAARHVGVSRRHMYAVRDAEPDFAGLWDDALREGIDLLEHEAHRRAFRGTDKPVYQQGVQVGTIREYSDTLTIFLLKAHDPQKYRDNSRIELAGKLDVEGKSLTELRQELLKKLAALGIVSAESSVDITA